MKSKTSTSNPPIDRLRTLPATRKFLLFLAAFGLYDDVLPRGLILKAAWNSRPSEYLAELDREFRDRATAKLYWQLKKQGFLKTRHAGDRMRYALTDKGFDVVVRERMKLAPKLRDDRILIVSFDIPEQERSARDALRLFLQRCGFKRWHDSLWITDRDVHRPFAAALGRMGVGRWITLYEAREL